VVTERTSQRPLVGIVCHQRASRPHAAVAKLTQRTERRSKRLDADIIKQGARGWEREGRERDDQISQP